MRRRSDGRTGRSADRPGQPEKVRTLGYVGSGLLACRRAYARRRTGPSVLLRCRSQARAHRVALNVSLDPVELLDISDQVVVALILPERPGPAEHRIGLMPRKTLELRSGSLSAA